jgi:thiosulfate dehydrogenase [quinone] large subunit
MNLLFKSRLILFQKAIFMNWNEGLQKLKDSLIAKMVYTILRIYVGWEWLSRGIDKNFGTDSINWVGSQAGAHVTTFLQGALQKSVGPHPDVQWLYADFAKYIALPHATIFSFLTAWGELAVGIALILGFFTTFALLGALLLNFNYLFAGTVSINPLLILIEMTLIRIGPSVYYLGLDHILLPRLRKSFLKSGNVPAISNESIIKAPSV